MNKTLSYAMSRFLANYVDEKKEERALEELTHLCELAVAFHISDKYLPDNYPSK